MVASDHPVLKLSRQCGAATDHVGGCFDAGSFRDRSARVFIQNSEVYRALAADGLKEWTICSASRFFQDAMGRAQIVNTEIVTDPVFPESFNDQNQWKAALHHQRIPVISYPYEWCFSMLKDAASLSLSLLEQSLNEDVILKDATPYNVQFQGTNPTFIDTSSFAALRPGQTWDGYRQFCQQFLYPMMLQAYRGFDFQPLLRGRLEGISPQQMANLLSVRDFFRRGVISHVWLHAKLNKADTSRSASGMQSGVAKSLAESGFHKEVIVNNVRALRGLVSRLKWKATESRWFSYDTLSAPAHNDGPLKEGLISQIASSRHWGHVWDIGCNLGRYSRIAAKHADCVLAIDSDHLTIDRLYRNLTEEEVSNITPLLLNIADPSPGLGWRCAERKPLQERSKPDLILCLAVLHHLVIGENLLLNDVMGWLASLNATVVIEFVDRSDPQVKSLLSNRTDQFTDYSREQFVHLLKTNFGSQQSWELPSGTRTLFLVHPR